MNMYSYVNRYRAQVLHGKDSAPGRKWNQPNPSEPYAGRKRKNKKKEGKCT